jgi:uncharacterized protein YkwD
VCARVAAFRAPPARVGALGACCLAICLPMLARTAPAVALAPCSGASIAPDGRNAALIDAATLCLMNRVRAEYGLRALRRNGPLAAIAAGQADDMVRGDYFADDSLSGQTPLARIIASPYRPTRTHVRLQTAQNIGWGTGPNATPTGIFAAWMASPPHRAIILTAAYRDVGVGVAPSVPAEFVNGYVGGTYAVEFGARER